MGKYNKIYLPAKIEPIPPGTFLCWCQIAF